MVYKRKGHKQRSQRDEDKHSLGVRRAASYSLCSSARNLHKWNVRDANGGRMQGCFAKTRATERAANSCRFRHDAAVQSQQTETNTHGSL